MSRLRSVVNTVWQRLTRGFRWIVGLRHRPLALSLWSAALLLVVGGLGWLVFASPVLVATQVDVRGADGPLRETISRIAGRQLHQPLAKVDTQAIADEVGRAGLFAAVEVSRNWPRTVSVVVQQREPVFALRDAQGVVKVVDSAGVVFATASKVPEGIPLATVANPADPVALRTAATVVSSISAAQRRSLSGVSVPGPQRVVLRLKSTEVVWGDATRGAEKAAVVDRIMATGTFRRIDVSAPDSPATMG